MQYDAQEAIRLTKELVGQESCNPGSYEAGIGDFVYQWLERTGARMSRDEALKNRFNIIAKLDGIIDDPSLVYICHLDTVPIGEGWHCDPLAGKIEDGKIYGRGACDMKSGLAAGMLAFREIAEQKRTLKHSFVFIASVDEEDVMTGVKSLIRKGILTKSSWVLDSEPTNLEIQVAHKGKTWFNITAKGAAAHASTPEKGIDAVSAMGEFISALNAELRTCPTHPELGRCSATYGMIKGGINTNIVPDACTLTIDLRLVPPVTNQESVKMVSRAIQKAEGLVAGVKFLSEVTSMHPAIERDDGSRLLAELKKAVLEVRGEKAVINFFPGYTDSAVVAAETGSIDCMSYGPADLAQAHKPDEFCKCENIISCEKVLKRLAENILF